MMVFALFVATAGFSGVCPVQAFLFAPNSGPLRGRGASLQRRSNRRGNDHRSAQGTLQTRTFQYETLAISMMCLEPPEEVECDVVIVGGGPAGCTCALYTSRAKHKTVIIDKSPHTGALARTSVIANYPGVDKSMNGEVLLDLMRGQAVDCGARYHRAQVFMVSVEGDWKCVYTPGATFKARCLVLATGAMGREPYFKGEDTFLGRGVSYCATCDGAFYQDSEVAVVGNNPEAIEEAEFLIKFVSKLHWVTQTAVPSTNADTQALLAHENVEHWSQTHMASIEGDKSGVTGVRVSTKNGDSQIIPVDGVFVYVEGSKPITDFVEGTVELKKDGGVQTNDEMMTNVEGIFAIGDIRNTPFKQAVVAASDGCIAAMGIGRYLKNHKNIQVDWIHQ